MCSTWFCYFDAATVITGRIVSSVEIACLFLTSKEIICEEAGSC